MSHVNRFSVSWDKGAYYVSIPNYQGGEVVPGDVADKLMAALKPFAELADICDHFKHPDSKRICKVTIDGKPHSGPTAGECRAAREAYSLAQSQHHRGSENV